MRKLKLIRDIYDIKNLLKSLTLKREKRIKIIEIDKRRNIS